MGGGFLQKLPPGIVAIKGAGAHITTTASCCKTKGVFGFAVPQSHQYQPAWDEPGSGFLISDRSTAN